MHILSNYLIYFKKHSAVRDILLSDYFSSDTGQKSVGVTGTLKRLLSFLENKHFSLQDFPGRRTYDFIWAKELPVRKSRGVINTYKIVSLQSESAY